MRHISLDRPLKPLVRKASPGPRTGVGGAGGWTPAPSAPTSIVDDDGLQVAVYSVDGDADSSDSVHNSGGALVVTAPVELVFWGTQWQTAAAPSANDIVGAATRIINSSYLAELEQYGFQRVTVQGSTIVTSPAPPSNYSFDDVGNLVWNLIDDGKFPEPDDDGGRIIYMVFMPDGTTGPANERGAHGDPSDYDFPFDVDYAWVGFVSAGSLDYVTDVFSHELVEAITDPEPHAPAWVMDRNINGGDEIGDACNNTVDRVDGLLVQAYWSERQKACVIPQKHRPLAAPSGARLTATRQFGLDQTDILVVDGEGAVNVMWVAGAGNWQGPVRITATGIAPAGADLAASPQYGLDQQTDVFFIDNDGALNVMWVVGGDSWQGPVRISAAGIAPPGADLAASPQYGLDQQTDIFFIDNSGALNVMWVVGGGSWQGPVPISSGFAAPGSRLAVSPQYGLGSQTDVFVVDRSGALNVMWVVGGGTWQGPVAIAPAGSALGGAGLAATAQFGVDGQTDVATIGLSGALTISWVNGGGAWQGPLRTLP